MTAALDLRDLHFAYGKNASIRGVSLSLRPGDCYGFLGHNGAGKTTVMRLALGLLRPQRGSVHVFGIDAARDPCGARARIGALIERPGFLPHASARQNLRALARLQGLPHRLATAECARVLEHTGLVAAADRRVGTFSLGMRQRLGVAQALLGAPPLLLLDEPTNGLDPEGIADLRALLRSLAQGGTAVLVSSHQLAELEGLCTRIGVLREGAMVVEGDLAHLRAQLHSHHVVQGTPLPALEQCLQRLGVASQRDGERLLADLRGQAPAKVVRELAAAGELHAFAPAPVTLEAIYRNAAQLQSQSVAAAVAPAFVSPPLSTAQRPLGRAYLHELRQLRLHRSTPLLLALPAGLAAWSVVAYRHKVDANLARVKAGELFSADAGSGHLATAHALQTALPVLALCVLWFGSQSVAADLAHETLRNTLQRSVRRGDVLLGKFGALATLALVGFALLMVTTTATAGGLFGFGDLDEVNRTDRQVLASARDVAAQLWPTVFHLAVPLLSVAAIGLMASAIARRPARALLLALLCALVGEAFRDRLRDHAGWLLGSHLPLGLRDDSVLGYFFGIARGASDALWAWREQAWQAPFAWLAAALLLAHLALRRQRVQ